MSKFDYFLNSLAKFVLHVGYTCPNCGSASRGFVERKRIITQLNRCEGCRLLYRTPTDDVKRNKKYYEEDYVEGFTTTLPTELQLTSLKRCNFSGTEKDYSKYLTLLEHLGLGQQAMLFDFGCSWGYGSYQFQQAGYLVRSFDVAPTRRRFAQDSLGVKVVEDMDRLIGESVNMGTYDVFFSAHVLEHMPSPNRAFDYAMHLLKPGGFFVAITPNGSMACRLANKDWSTWWGEVHPNFIDDEFLDSNFSNSPRLLASSPNIGDIGTFTQNVCRRMDELTGSELFFVARKSCESW